MSSFSDDFNIQPCSNARSRQRWLSLFSLDGERDGSKTMGMLFELVFEVVAAVVWWILLHLIFAPFIYIIATPVVLIVALFGSGTYGNRVRSGYRALRDLAFAC